MKIIDTVPSDFKKRGAQLQLINFLKIQKI